MKKKKKIIIVAALLIVVGAGLFVALRTDENNSAGVNTHPDDINYSPPTEEELSAAEKHKQDLINQQNNQTAKNSSGSKTTVAPFITFAGHVQDSPSGDVIEVRAYIPGVYESGGICTAKFTRASQIFSRQIDAIPSASTTNCETLAIPRSDFPSPGTWTVVVDYSSDDSSGTSKQQTFEVK